MRGLHFPERLFEIDAHLGGILHAEAAPLGTHASLHRAQCLGIGMTGWHVEVLPNLGQILLVHAKQIDALPAGDLHRRNSVFVHHVGDAAQIARRGDPAEHARHHRVGAVFLDVGMGALVDEARLRIIARLLRPGAQDVIIQRRAATCAAIGRAPFQKTHGRWNRDELLHADRFTHFLMGVIGAATHRLGGVGLRRISPAHRGREYLFHQPGAGAAGRRGFGVLAHVFKREQAFLLDGARDDPLRHAVATAHFHAVGHGRRLVLALMPCIAQMRFAEHQMIADIGNILPVADQLKVTRAIGGITHHHAAHHAVILDHQFLVHPAHWVVQHNLLGIGTAGEIAGGKQIDAGHLELGGGDRPLIAANAEFRQMRRTHPGHLKQRRHQTVGIAAVRDTFADRINARVVGLQRVAHHNAALAMQAGDFRQLEIGTDSHRHHHQIGRNFLAALELQTRYPALARGDLCRLFLQNEFQALVLQRALQHDRRRAIELALHQPGHQMYDGDIHAAQLQSIGCLQAQQTSADDHRVAILFRGLDHRLGIGDVAVSNYPWQIGSRHRQDKRIGTGSEQQPVIGLRGAVFGDHLAPGAVDLHHFLAQVQANALRRVPGLVVEHDLLQGHLARKHRREQNAVVIGVRLRAKHGNVVEIGREFEQLLDGLHPRHAIAHHYQFQLSHSFTSCKIQVYWHRWH